MVTFTLLLVLSQSAPAAEQTKPAPAGNGPALQSSGVTLRAALEVSAEALPQDVNYDGFIGVRPIAAVGVGDDFSIELGPTFRLRVIDSAPGQRSSDYGGIIRHADWNEPSDFGQILQSLRIAADSSPFLVRAGFVKKKTLGLGHLIDRYSNQENPDYHPAAATIVGVVGPFRAEGFASDILGARIFAAELAWDLGRTFSSNDNAKDRYVLAFQIAHDAAQAGNPPTICDISFSSCVDFTSTQRMTLVQLDGSVVFVRNASGRFLGLAGAGSRSNAAANVGFVAGAAADLIFPDLNLSLKLELRKQSGGFRQGMFGPAYELSRFAGLGFSGVPLAQENLPDTFSVFTEVRAQAAGMVTVDAALEYFAFGRTDLDVTANTTLLKEWLVAQARLTAVGIGQTPRWALNAGFRMRLFSALYVLASAGTVYFPQPDGTLIRGITATAGAGIDFER